MRASRMLRIPLRNSTRELRKWSRVFCGHSCSRNGMATAQKKQPGACGSLAVVLSSISALLHFHGQYLILQPGAGGGKGGHGGGQTDVAAQRSHFDHELVALLEQADLAFGGKRELHADLVVVLPLDEREGCFGAGDYCRIVFVAVEHLG